MCVTDHHKGGEELLGRLDHAALVLVQIIKTHLLVGSHIFLNEFHLRAVDAWFSSQKIFYLILS